MQTKKSVVGRTRADPLATVAVRLASKLPNLGPRGRPALLRALHELLDGSDEAARLARTQMQIHLINVADQLLSKKADRSYKSSPARLLSTEEAARMMGCSRPYVAMLIDAKKLADGVVTDGGHRRVPEASVLAWLKAREIDNRARPDADYKTAARRAGMYEIPEADFVAARQVRKSGR